MCITIFLSLKSLWTMFYYHLATANMWSICLLGVKYFKGIKVYIEYRKTKLETYFMSVLNLYYVKLRKTTPVNTLGTERRTITGETGKKLDFDVNMALLKW